MMLCWVSLVSVFQTSGVRLMRFVVPVAGVDAEVNLVAGALGVAERAWLALFVRLALMTARRDAGF